MIACRIKTLIGDTLAIDRIENWRTTICLGLNMLSAANISVERYDEPIGNITNIIGGEEWSP